MRARRAFSIVELLTALVLLAVGLAAFARAAAAIARLEGDSRLRRVVAGALQARLDSLSGLPCGTARAGDAQLEGVHEHWTAEPTGRRLVVTTSIDVPGRPSLSRGLRLSMICRP